MHLDLRKCGRMLIGATEPAMPTEPKKPLIVISYAHADEPEKPAEGEVKWLSFVTGYLRPAIKHGAVDLWLDRLMPGGADWEPEIEQKLRACDIFILLVSRHSLSSDYVVDKEIALIRERQAKGEAVHFYPLVLTPTPKITLDLVRDKNMRPRDGKPFSDYPLNERYRHMADAADEIAEIAKKIARCKSRARQKSGASIFDKRTLEAWVRSQGHEVVLPVLVRAALRSWPELFATLRLRPRPSAIRQLAGLTGTFSERLLQLGLRQNILFALPPPTPSSAPYVPKASLYSSPLIAPTLPFAPMLPPSPPLRRPMLRLPP